MEQNFSTKCGIDIEINTLEDAYVNIAREEENLIKGKEINESKKDNVNDLESSILDPEKREEWEDLMKRYRSATINTSACSQIRHQFMRRHL